MAKFDAMLAHLRAAAFSPDGRAVVSASWDETLRLCDVSDLVE